MDAPSRGHGRTKLVGPVLALIGVAAAMLLILMAGSASAATPSPFFNGFEESTEGWEGPIERVPSGTAGVTSASGSYHAVIGDGGGAYTRWGGYTDEFPTGGYTTSIDVYLDLESCPANDSRVDWSSAISDPEGNHRRDFIFSFGCYTDEGDYAVFSASNNAPGWPKNPGREPLYVYESGWYTLQHHFYDNGEGVLAVDMSVINSSGEVLATWTLSDPTDIIGETVGGNRYGWFVDNAIPDLPVDNSRLDVSVGPTSKEECKKGGWETFTSPVFKNQGDCVSYVATSGRNEAAG